MKMTIRQKKYALASLLVVVAGVAAGIAWSVNANSADGTGPDVSGLDTPGLTLTADAQQLPGLKLQRVESYQRSVVHTGLVESKSQTMVGFQRGGMITSLLVDEGQRVTALQKLAVLDSRHLQAQQSILQARLSQAKSVLAELEKGPRQESIKAARDMVADLQQQLNAQELRARRSEALLRTNSIAKQDYERELYAKRGLEARLSAAQNQLDELQAGTRSEQIDAQDSSVKSIEAEQQALQYNLDDCQLAAPFSGMIVARFIDSGTVVTAGTPVFELIDDRNLEIHVGVPQAMLGQLQAGSSYKITAGQHRLTGTLRVVLPQVDPQTRTCNAILDVTLPEQDAGILITGQLAKVRFTQQIQESGFWVPRLSLTADHSGLWSCYVVGGHSKSEPTQGSITGVATKHSVEVLYQRDEWVFVRGTLRDGQFLISEGMHRVVPGQEVTVRASDPSSDAADFSSAPVTSSNVR